MLTAPPEGKRPLTPEMFGDEDLQREFEAKAPAVVAASDGDPYFVECGVPWILKQFPDVAHRREALRHLLDLYAPDEPSQFKARMEGLWTFPDGLEVKSVWTVFSQEGRDKAISNFEYGQLSEREGGQPFCTIAALQGIKGEPVRVEDVCADIIRSWKLLHQKGWSLSIVRSKGLQFQRLRDRYFEKKPMADYPYYHALNTNRKRVHTLLELPQ